MSRLSLSSRSAATGLVLLLSMTTLASCDLLSGSDAIDVKPYERNPFTAEAAPPEWSVEVKEPDAEGNRVVILTLAQPSRALTSLLDGEQATLRLKDTGTGLPEFLSFTVGIEENYVGPVNPLTLGELAKGTLEIQDWDLEGVISGLLVGELETTKTINERFWVDLRMK